MIKTAFNPQVAVAFDVDGTLNKLDGTPNYPIIDLLRKYAIMGCDIYVWSGCGLDYAKQWIVKLGLDAYGATAIIKRKNTNIDICYDDQEVKLAAVNIQVDNPQEW